MIPNYSKNEMANLFFLFFNVNLQAFVTNLAFTASESIHKCQREVTLNIAIGTEGGLDPAPRGNSQIHDNGCP